MIQRRVAGTSFLLAFIFVTLHPLTSNARPINPQRLTPVVKAVRKVSPAVINIYTKKQITTSPFRSGDDEGVEDMPFYERRTRNVQSLGSGVIIDPRGYAVTNEHVVTKATEIYVQLSDNRTFAAKTIGADRRFDLAVLKIETKKKLPHASMGKSSDLMPGETVIAIGNPFGLSHTISTGVVSALNRRLKIKNQIYEDFIQTDTAINPGNSGGPLLNILGELIGITTAVHKSGSGIGFAAPIDRVREATKDLLRYGRVRGGWLGMTASPYRGPGLYVTSVATDSPASKAGIKQGDIILGVRGKRVNTSQDLTGSVSRMIPNETIKFTLSRGTLKVKVGAYTPQVAWTQFQLHLGIRVDDASKHHSKLGLSTKNGVVLTWVKDNGSAHKAGLRAGDVIHDINGTRITSMSRLYKVTAKLRTGNSLVMTIQRGKRYYRLTIQL